MRIQNKKTESDKEFWVKIIYRHNFLKSFLLSIIVSKLNIFFLFFSHFRFLHLAKIKKTTKYNIREEKKDESCKKLIQHYTSQLLFKPQQSSQTNDLSVIPYKSTLFSIELNSNHEYFILFQPVTFAIMLKHFYDPSKKFLLISNASNVLFHHLNEIFYLTLIVTRF